MANPTASSTQAATTKLPDLLSRRRALPSGDEEATSTIRLGDFSADPTLSVSEARVLLNTLLEHRAGDTSIPPPPNTDVFVKTRKYMNQASRHKSQAAADQVSRISGRLVEESGGLVGGFERAQLSSLCCDTAEEARTLIPSLEGKIGDDELQAVLDDISKLRDFT